MSGHDHDLWLADQMAAEERSWREWYTDQVAPDRDEDTSTWGDAEWTAAEEAYVDEHFDHWERERERQAEGPLNRWSL